MCFRRFILLLLLPLAVTASGQTDNGFVRAKPKSAKTTFFYDLNWQLTTLEKSYFKREAIFDFTDMVFDGLYRDYNKADVLIAEGSYHHGAKAGLHTEYFANHSLRSTIEYDGTDFTIWEFNDEQKKDSVRHGTGSFTLPYFYLSGLVKSPTWKQGVVKGYFRFGKRAGIWTYEDLGKRKTDEEYYENGKLSRRINFSETGTIELDYRKDVIISVNALITESMAYDQGTFSDLNAFFEQKPTYSASFNRTVTYPGGLKRLLLKLAQSEAVVAGSVCILKLKVDEHGQIPKYFIQLSADPASDEQAINAVKVHEKRFLPAIRNGQPYATFVYLPISSGQDWIDFVNSSSIEDLLQMR